MSTSYAVKDRDGTIHPESSKKDAQRSRKAYGGMVMQSRTSGNDQTWKPWKRHRVFLWVFLAIQAAFLIWVITGAASKGPATGAQVAQLCNNHAWYPLYSSQAACVQNSGALLADASDVGKTIGVGLIVVVWVVVDFLVALTYGIYRLARRSA
jgi:hypothetical protein